MIVHESIDSHGTSKKYFQWIGSFPAVSKFALHLEYEIVLEQGEAFVIALSSIEKMLKTGKINEIIRFAVRQLSRGIVRNKNMSVFTQSFNPMTGTICWEEKDPDYDYHQEVARSAFADMLHDKERNEKYFAALKAAIDKKHALGKKANVLDIGTGTGLLSMMAAKCGADTITACEAFKPMAECAIKIIEDNGYADKIKLIFKRSTEITVGIDGDMPNRANILVTEVFDTELIGEGALSTFRHAHKVLLDNDSIVIPHSGTVWAQVVDSPLVCAWNRIEPVLNSTGDKILVDTPTVTRSCSGAAAVHDLQLSQLPRDSFKLLTKPLAVCRFDWSDVATLQLSESFSHKTKSIAAGTAHAVFMWWDLKMDTEGQVLLSCAPVWEHPDVKLELNHGKSTVELNEKIPWRDHWMQAVYYLSPAYEICSGQELTLVTSHDEYSFWYHLNDGSSMDEVNYQRPICDCFVHLAYSRTRIGQLNDKKRNKKYIQALEKRITSDSVCLCLSDNCLLGLAAAKLGSKKVIIFESNGLSHRVMEMFVKANGLSEKVRIVNSKDDLNPDDGVNLIFGEPNFVTSILAWDNIYFWHLSSRYPKHIARIPSAVTVRAVAVEFKDLHKIRAPVRKCEGFDMSRFDELVQEQFLQVSSDISDNQIEAHPLWEYPGQALTAPFTVVELHLDRNIDHQPDIQNSDTAFIACTGNCNGVALWVDWTLDASTEVSTGPIKDIVPGSNISWDPYTRQGVFLPRKNFAVTRNDLLQWSVHFSPISGAVQFTFKITMGDN
ncbi:protein arginine N-methyltransferase 7 isoform X1 [Neodiprion fabricii]|uniref:protein arginine N-methyltransferase 7 isoform X1 n=1 Tax=Neodiprion fabricii TaxID=2872261 RepID=UPI001ED94D9C|nr:protein arginine N-methyltransferase 7 isoform X1 [Neodiprion fabricii]